MPVQIPNFIPALPEILILVMSCIILLAGVFIKKPQSNYVTLVLAQITLISGMVLTLWISHHYLNHQHSIVTFDGFFMFDHLSVLLKVFVYITAIFVFAYSRQYLLSHHIAYNEFHVLALFSLLGMLILISSNHFLSLFLGLELTTLPLYALVALKRDSAICSEAGIKFFVIGTIATGMLLYGISMIYGASSGELSFKAVANVTYNFANTENLVLVLGLVFVVVGIAFKLGSVPFHMWMPDVFEGAPSAVTLFLASATKISAFAMAVRLLFALYGLQVEWQQLLILTSALSIALGNLIAIVQTNIKRMLAYSSIAHIGYMLLGLVALTKNGNAAATFYILSYAVMSLGAFGLVVILSKIGYEMESIDDFKGLNTRNPWLAFMMMLIMFSLAGIPPLVGFIAKVGVLEAVIEANLVWLAVYGIVFAIIGSYYYIRVVKVMYFEEPEITTPIACPTDMRVAITVNGLALLFLGMFPGFLFKLCQNAF